MLAAAACTSLEVRRRRWRRQQQQQHLPILHLILRRKAPRERRLRLFVIAHRTYNPEQLKNQKSSPAAAMLLTQCEAEGTEHHSVRHAELAMQAPDQRLLRDDWHVTCEGGVEVEVEVEVEVMRVFLQTVQGAGWPCCSD